MTARLSLLAAPLLAFASVAGCNAIVGLSDLRNVDCVGDCGAPGSDAGGDVESDAPPADAEPGTCTNSPDPKNAAVVCSPEDLGEAPCAPRDAGPDAAECPDPTSKCAALTSNALNPIDFRVSHLQIWYPPVLRKVADALVHPQTSPQCLGGQMVLNALIQLDTTKKVLRVGSAKPPADGKTFTFTRETFAPSAFSTVCPGTPAPPAPIEIAPFEVPYALSGQNIASKVIARTHIASWDTGLPIPSLVPLVEASIPQATISPDRNCIGSYDPSYHCGKESQGWTTGGLIVGKIPLDEADQIALPIAGCQSLCAVLADDPSRVDGANCKKEGGKVVEFGDTCVGGTGCKNAMWFSAAFSAQAVHIAP